MISHRHKAFADVVIAVEATDLPCQIEHAAGRRGPANGKIDLGVLTLLHELLDAILEKSSIRQEERFVSILRACEKAEVHSACHCYVTTGQCRRCLHLRPLRLSALFEARGSFPIARQAKRFCDDVCNVTGQTRNIECRAVEDLDAQDPFGADAFENGICTERLGRRTAPVDEYVERSLSKAAFPALAAPDGKAGYALHHVRGTLGREAVKEIGVVDDRPLGIGGGGRDLVDNGDIVRERSRSQFGEWRLIRDGFGYALGSGLRPRSSGGEGDSKCRARRSAKHVCEHPIPHISRPR